MALTDNIISYWKLDGNSTDSAGSNNGSDTAITYSLANGKIDQGAGFNGSSSQIVVTDNASIQPVNVSISFWAKIASYTGSNYPALVDRTNAISADGYRVILNGDNGKMVFGVDGNNTFVELSSTTTLTTGVYQHWVFTYNGTTAIIYLNGTSDASVGESGNITYGTTTNLGIGHRQTGTGNYLSNGSCLDEIGLWGRALTSSEVTELYNGGAGLTYPFSSFTPTPMMHHMAISGGLM